MKSQQKYSHLSIATRHTYIGRVVEPQSLVQAADLLDLILLQVEAAHVQVLRKTALVVALGDNGNTALSGPAQQDLRRALAVSVGDGLHDLVVKQHGGVLCLLHVELDERQRAERAVGGHGDVALLAELEEGLLGEVGVVLDLESLGELLCVAEQVEQKSAVVVADAERLDQAGVVEGLHGVVGFFERGVAELDLVVLVVEAGRVPHGRVDILECDREVLRLSQVLSGPSFVTSNLQ
jgi:hypothetical protein